MMKELAANQIHGYIHIYSLFEDSMPAEAYILYSLIYQLV